MALSYRQPPLLLRNHSNNKTCKICKSEARARPESHKDSLTLKKLLESKIKMVRGHLVSKVEIAKVTVTKEQRLRWNLIHSSSIRKSERVHKIQLLLKVSQKLPVKIHQLLSLMLAPIQNRCAQTA